MVPVTLTYAFRSLKFSISAFAIEGELDISVGFTSIGMTVSRGQSMLT